MHFCKLKHEQQKQEGETTSTADSNAPKSKNSKIARKPTTNWVRGHFCTFPETFA